MAVTVETLEKLERRITLTLPASLVGAEVEQRLKKLARTVKADGFRPGKVPMSFVAQRYGQSVQYEVITDQLGEAFAQAAGEAKLRVAGTPRLSQKDAAAQGEIAFDATFEVYPEIKMGDLAAAERATIWSSADAVLAASTGIAFPFRMVEAFAVGAPVVARDTATYREVAADAATFVTGEGADAWGAAIATVLDDADAAKRLGVLAGDRSRGFSWLDAGDRVWALHAEL